MKRVNAFLCMLLCVLMLTTVVSCTKEPAETPDDQAKETVVETKNEDVKKEPETGNELWKLIDEKMESLESYEADIALEMVMYMNGFKFDNSAKGYEISSKKDGNDAYYYRFLDSKMVCDQISLNENIKSIEAYNNGMAFYSNISEGVAQNLCSKMTYEEYDEYTEGSTTDEVDFEDCTKAEFVKNEDGTYKLDFSGYTKKAIGDFLDFVGMEDGVLGADVEDLKISVVVNSDYTVKEMVMELVFDVEETDTAVPVLVETMKYSKYNEAVRKTDDIDPDGYTEVDDIRVITKFEEALAEYCNSAEGSFVLDIKETFYNQYQTMEFNEKDTVSFGKMNGGYYYVITAETDTAVIGVDYKNGVQKITVDGQAQTVQQSEEEAIDYINGLIDYAKYTTESVTDVEKISDGVYKLTVNSSPELLGQLEANSELEITVESSTQEIIVTFDGDKLAKAEYSLKVVAEQDFNVDIMATMTVNKTSSEGQSF